MVDGIVAQLNPFTIIASPPVDLAAEMRLFDTNYAQLYGADKLPADHGTYSICSRHLFDLRCLCIAVVCVTKPSPSMAGQSRCGLLRASGLMRFWTRAAPRCVSGSSLLCRPSCNSFCRWLRCLAALLYGSPCCIVARSSAPPRATLQVSFSPFVLSFAGS